MLCKNKTKQCIKILQELPEIIPFSFKKQKFYEGISEEMYSYTAYGVSFMTRVTLH